MEEGIFRVGEHHGHPLCSRRGEQCCLTEWGREPSHAGRECGSWRHPSPSLGTQNQRPRLFKVSNATHCSPSSSARSHPFPPLPTNPCQQCLSEALQYQMPHLPPVTPVLSPWLGLVFLKIPWSSKVPDDHLLKPAWVTHGQTVPKDTPRCVDPPPLASWGSSLVPSTIVLRWQP